MFSHNGKVSSRQVEILLILQMFNTGILILPRIAANIADQDGYVLPIIALVFGIIYVYSIITLTTTFKGDTFVEFTLKILPKGLAYVIIWVFALKIVVTTGLELRMFGEMISQVLLPKTPLPVIMLAMLLTVSYLVKSGIEAIARAAEVLVYFIFIPLIIVLIFIVVKADYKQLMPFFQAKPMAIGKGAFIISLSFMPIEFMLMLTGLMKKPEKAKKTTLWAIVAIAIIECIIIVLTYSGIGLAESKRQIWPVLTLMQSIQFPGSLIENQEILMMTCWIFSIFMYISSGLYFTSLIGSRCFKFKRENVFVIPFIPIVYLIATIPRSLVEAHEYYINFQRYFGIWFLVPVPVALLVLARVRKVGGSYEKA